MFDIAWSELALIGAVALVVIGPKDLPKVMRVMGQWTRKARLLAGEFQNNFDEMVRQADLDDVRRQVQAVNPAALKDKVEAMVDSKGIEEALRIDPLTAATVTPAVALDAPGALAAAEAPALPEAAPTTVADTPHEPMPATAATPAFASPTPSVKPAEPQP